MRHDNHQSGDESDLEPLEDKTEALTLHSKKTRRAERKLKLKASRPRSPSRHLLDLPYDLVFKILCLLQPSSLFNLRRVNRSYHEFIGAEEARIAKGICNWRYVCLQKCFHLPVLLENVDLGLHPTLQSLDRSELHSAIRKPYQHIQPPDPTLICTCFSCLLRWTSLCVIPDFAYWQDNLDKGVPIPMIPRGGFPEWNRKLVDANAALVRKALYSPLWHARLLEEHLESTTRAISRHSANRGNKRRRYRMTKEDVDSGTDLFLERSGPPTADVPFMRDNYYMLESFLPNRGWNSEADRWMYMPAEQHDTDLRTVVVWAKWRAERAAVNASDNHGETASQAAPKT